jgi:hypothetical protein
MRIIVYGLSLSFSLLIASMQTVQATATGFTFRFTAGTVLVDKIRGPGNACGVGISCPLTAARRWRAQTNSSRSLLSGPRLGRAQEHGHALFIKCLHADLDSMLCPVSQA